LRAQFPEAILESFSVPGLGAKKINALYERLHVSSIDQPQQACQAPTPTTYWHAQAGAHAQIPKEIF
jgi:DNA polymerase/3'-5' exonuclease PolX